MSLDQRPLQHPICVASAFAHGRDSGLTWTRGSSLSKRSALAALLNIATGISQNVGAAVASYCNYALASVCLRIPRSIMAIIDDVNRSAMR